MDDVDELIDRCRAKLGVPDGVYRPAPVWKNLLLGGGLLLGGLVVGGLVLAVAPRAAAGLSKLLLVMPVAGGLVLWHGWAARGRAILTYPDGLLPVGRGAVDWIPWDAVGPLSLRAKDAVPAGPLLTVGRPTVMLNAARLTVDRDGGPPLLIRPALIGYEQLAARVQRERFARRWPEAVRAFDAGEVVGFGDLDLSRDGIGKGRTAQPWDRVKSVEVKGGKVIVKRWKAWLAWAAVPLEKVPDPAVFLALADHARVAAGPADDPDDRG